MNRIMAIRAENSVMIITSAVVLRRCPGLQNLFSGWRHFGFGADPDRRHIIMSCFLFFFLTKNLNYDVKNGHSHLFKISQYLSQYERFNYVVQS